MNILYINWVPSRFFHTKGGGVSIYQKNLIDSAINKGHKVTYLTAGYIYSPISPGVKIRHVKSPLFDLKGWTSMRLLTPKSWRQVFILLMR